MRIVSAFAGVLLGLGFLAGGVMIARETLVPYVVDWYAMRAWQPVDAVVLSVERADDRVAATYQYLANGRAYYGTRITVATFNDNLGSYHDDLAGELAAHLRTGEPVTAWYDPGSPSNAVIDRDLRPGLFAAMLLFCAVFVAAGAAVIVFSVRPRVDAFAPPSKRQLRAEYDEKRRDPAFRQTFLEYTRWRVHELRHPDRASGDGSSWQSRREWRESRIPARARRNAVTAWTVALAANVILVPLVMVGIDEVSAGNFLILLGLPLPVAALYLVVRAARSTRSALRYRDTGFVMSPFPGSIGGQVGGHVDFDGPLPVAATYEVTLECVFVFRGRGDNDTGGEQVHFSERGRARAERTPNGIRLSFVFDVPDGLPAADADQSGDHCAWRLRIDGDVPGVDLAREFSIPVTTGIRWSGGVGVNVSRAAGAARAGAAQPQRDAVTAGDYVLSPLLSVMHVTETPGSISIRQPMFRKPLPGFVLLVVGAAFVTPGVVMAGGFGSMALATWIFVVPFALVGAPALAGGLYVLFNRLASHVDADGVATTRTVLGLPVMSRVVPRARLTSLRVKRTGSTGSGPARVEQFRVEAVYDRGATTTLAEGIDGADLAQAFAARIGARLGISRAGVAEARKTRQKSTRR